MAISRAERRAERSPRAQAEFGKHSAAALDLLELTELAWHDCYREVTPPEEVIDDLFVLADGSILELIYAARLATADWRDLRVSADARRAENEARRH